MLLDALFVAFMLDVGVTINTGAISVSNWLADTHVSFKVTKVKGVHLSLAVLQPQVKLPSATFTDTEVLIGFQIWYSINTT